MPGGRLESRSETPATFRAAVRLLGANSRVSRLRRERMSSPTALSAADTRPCEDAFMRAHGLDPAVQETERLGREFFGAAYRRTECSVRIDGDFGTEYLLVRF